MVAISSLAQGEREIAEFDRCEVGLPSRCGQQLVPSLRRGSGYEQAKAKLRCIESDEVAVAFGPPA